MQPCALVRQMNIPPFDRTCAVIRSIAIILMTRMLKAEAQKRKRKVRPSQQRISGVKFSTVLIDANFVEFVKIMKQ